MFFSLSRRARAVEHSSVAKQKVQGELGKTTDISTYAPGWRPCHGKCTYLLSLLLVLLDWLNLSSIFHFCQHCATKNERYSLTLVDLMLLLKFSESFWWYFFFCCFYSEMIANPLTNFFKNVWEMWKYGNGSIIRWIWSVTTFMYGDNCSYFQSIWVYFFSNTIIENGC